MENKEGKTDNTITISLEDFKLIKAFYPEFERAKGIEKQTNDFLIDWNGLMPVVEKIEGMGYDFDINRWSVYVSEKNKPNDIKYSKGQGSKIKSTYSAVIEFVKWYSNGK